MRQAETIHVLTGAPHGTAIATYPTLARVCVITVLFIVFFSLLVYARTASASTISTFSLKNGDAVCSDFCGERGRERYLKSFIRPSSDNDRTEVLKLQAFLRTHGGFSGLELSGVYDNRTVAAVKTFQLLHAEKVLEPWGISHATGFVYITTRNTINEIIAGREIPLTQDQRMEITESRERTRGMVEEEYAGEDEKQGGRIGAAPSLERLDTSESGDAVVVEGQGRALEFEVLGEGGGIDSPARVLEGIVTAVYMGVNKGAEVVFSGWFLLLLIVFVILFLLYNYTSHY